MRQEVLIHIPLGGKITVINHWVNEVVPLIATKT